MTLEEALRGSQAPSEILARQALLCVPHFDFSGRVQIGHIVVDAELAGEICEIFREILDTRFPIFRMTPIVEWSWSDDLSMEANNCSAFNYRKKVGQTSLSVHSFGRAIDINPRQNPYISGDSILPKGAGYDEAAPGTLVANGAVVTAFEKRGWVWGGHWTKIQDFHHFEKP